MAILFSNMQDDVIDICQELGAETDFNQTRVKRMINRGVQNFVRSTGCIMDTFSFTTVLNQVFYDSDDVANWAYAFKIISVKYITDTEFGKRLFPYRGGINALPREKAFGEPIYYYTRGQSGHNLKDIGTYPIIDVSSETLEVLALRYPTSDLSADGDEPEIAEAYRDAPIFYAVWRLFHAYSHKNAAFRAKALEHKALYDDLVQQYKFENYEDDQGGIQVTDSYAIY